MISGSSGGGGSTGGSVTVKVDGTAGQVITRTKTFGELTDEEKTRVLEQQKKDEEESSSKAQWGDGSYEKKIRYQSSKSESTVVTAGGGSNDASGTRTGVVVDRGSKFGTAGSAGTDGVQTSYSSAGRFGGGQASSGSSSVTTAGSSESGGNVVYGQYESRGGTGSTVHVAGTSQSGGSQQSGSHHGQVTVNEHRSDSSRGGAYGAAHFGESESSSGTVSSSSSSGTVSSSSLSGTVSSSSSSGGTAIDHESRFGSWSRDGGVGQSNYDHRAQQHGSSGWTAVGGGQSAGAQDERWTYENRNQASAGGSGGFAVGGGTFTSMHESEKSHEFNSTWDDSGARPKTYVRGQWRTNDDGLVRNGSWTRIDDDDGGDHRLNTFGGTVMNVVGAGAGTGISGDDSDLSVVQQPRVPPTVVTERQNQGSRRGESHETETVQRWRTVDGKLYKVNDGPGDWNQLLSRELGASTQVYEALDYGPQNYRRPAPGEPRQPTEAEDGKFKLYTRFKRDVATKKCGPTRCATVKCTIGPLSKDQEVWLSFRSRAWVNTLKKVRAPRRVYANSMGISFVYGNRTQRGATLFICFTVHFVIFLKKSHFVS